MKKNILYVGSKSISRHHLLKDSLIPFKIIEQNADEKIEHLNDSLEKIVTAIALQKMNHAIIPNNNDTIFVLTADTMVQNYQGKIFGKPQSRKEAIAMITDARKGMRLSTAFCIAQHKKTKLIKQSISVCTTEYVIDCPDGLIEHHLDTTISMECAGGFAIEGSGLQFLKTVNGSFSNIMGLPLYELRVELKKMGFFDN